MGAIACQGAVTETLGIVLTGLRKRDDVASERGADWVIVIRRSAKRRQRNLERRTAAMEPD
jgi:hypothetical protein